MKSTILETLRERASDGPDACFLHHRPLDHSLSYAELLEETEKIADCLQEQGIGKGKHVALVATHHWAFFPLLAACSARGSVLVPVNPDLHPDELAFILEDAAPSLIISEESVRLTKRFDRIPQLTIDELLAHTAGGIGGLPESPEPPEDVALMVYTSGTTGSGKAVMLSQSNLLSMAHLFRDFYEIRPTDNFLGVLPLHHMNGIMMTGLLPLVAGARVTIADVFSYLNAKLYWRTVEEEGTTICSLVPSIMAMLLKLFPYGIENGTEQVRFGFCGTAPLPADLWRTFEERFDFPIYQGYGLTETTTWATCTPFEAVHKYDTVGVPLGTEIKIDPSGFPTEEVVRGEVLICGPIVMTGYFKKGRLTREQFRGRFLKTGDIGFIDSDGELHITGRKKEIIIRNGININPQEIDDVLGRHPGVAESKTLGVADEISGEAIVSVCVCNDAGTPPDATNIKQWVRDNMSAFYVPNRVTTMGYLPKGPTGKVAIKQLEKILSGDLASDVLKKLTSWKHKRSAPSDAESIRGRIQTALIRGEPVRFLTYWGCGNRESISEIDRIAIERLVEYMSGMSLVQQARGELTIMLNDVHSRINTIPADRFEQYYGEIGEFSRSLGLKTIYQTEAWKSAGLDLDQILQEARTSTFDDEWNALPIRDQLLSQSARHFQGECSVTGARQYALACRREAPAFAELFPDDVFITYNGPVFDLCLPDLPKLYIYSYKKGKTEKPWFL